MEQEKINSDYFDNPDVHYCDFCAAKMTGDFETLKDGREMCTLCHSTKLDTLEQIEEVYDFTVSKMRETFSIDFKDSRIRVQMVETEIFNQIKEECLVPTQGYDPMSVALAVPNQRVLYIEKGSPKFVTIGYMVREMTNIWQFLNLNPTEIISKYCGNNFTLVCEGMAVWAEIQFMYLNKGSSYAQKREIYYEKLYKEEKINQYVLGFKEYKELYPFKEEDTKLRKTPFQKFPPLKTPLKYGTIVCDFCQKILYKKGFQVLRDGRHICDTCDSTALKKMDDRFYQLYDKVYKKMMLCFNINFEKQPILSMYNTRLIARMAGKRFVPTPGFDNRAVAVAVRKKILGNYVICLESHTPEIDAIEFIVHELTHVWQYINWDWTKGEKMFGKEDFPIVYEGMAVWASIQFMLFFLGEKRAKKALSKWLKTENDYGWGLYNYLKHYSFVGNPSDLKNSPFKTSLNSDGKRKFPINKEFDRLEANEMLKIM